MSCPCVIEVKNILNLLKEETGITWSYEGIYCARCSWDFCPSVIATPEKIKELTDKACEILRKHGYKVFNGYNIFYSSYAICVENPLINFESKCKFSCEGCPFAR